MTARGGAAFLLLERVAAKRGGGEVHED
jgi:hypothetical protein